MNEKCWLYCHVLKIDKKEFLLQSELYDGTKFELKVLKTSAILSESKKNAWLNVECQGREPNSSKLSITLPNPIINYGHRIVVHDKNISKNVLVKPSKIIQN